MRARTHTHTHTQRWFLIDTVVEVECCNCISVCRRSSKRISIFSRDSGPKAKGSIKYSGAKLHEKGVILEIEGLPTNQ